MTLLEVFFQKETLHSSINMRIMSQIMTNFKALALTAIFMQSSSSSIAQQEIGCFVQGECLNSFYLRITSADTPEACLDECWVRYLKLFILFTYICMRLWNKVKEFCFLLLGKAKVCLCSYINRQLHPLCG